MKKKITFQDLCNLRWGLKARELPEGSGKVNYEQGDANVLIIGMEDALSSRWRRCKKLRALYHLLDLFWRKWEGGLKVGDSLRERGPSP